MSKQEWLAEQNAKPFDVKDIYRYLMYLLERQDYTSGALLDKLRMHERFRRDSSLHQDAVNRVEELGYVNDERYMERMVKHHLESNIGAGKLKEKMYKKRFPKALIEIAVEMVKDKDYFPDVLHLKRKKYGDAPITDPKLRNRALGFLVRKGFDFGLCNKALSMTEDDIAEFDASQQDGFSSDW